MEKISVHIISTGDTFPVAIDPDQYVLETIEWAATNMPNNIYFYSNIDAIDEERGK